LESANLKARAGRSCRGKGSEKPTGQVNWREVLFAKWSRLRGYGSKKTKKKKSKRRTLKGNFTGKHGGGQKQTRCINSKQGKDKKKNRIKTTGPKRGVSKLVKNEPRDYDRASQNKERKKKDKSANI